MDGKLQRNPDNATLPSEFNKLLSCIFFHPLPTDFLLSNISVVSPFFPCIMRNLGAVPTKTQLTTRPEVRVSPAPLISLRSDRLSYKTCMQDVNDGSRA